MNVKTVYNYNIRYKNFIGGKMAINDVNSLISGRGGHLKRVNLKGFSGFTLAEVLITLVIIGVIAAMTIPTLINKTNNQEYVSRLKKAYSTLSQVTNRIIAEEGNPNSSIGGWASSTETIFDMYKKYLSNAKVCGIGVTGCFEGTYKQLNNTAGPNFNSGTRYTLVLADGSEMSMNNNASNFSADCSKNSNGTSRKCQTIAIDVNGAKGPNVIGRDTFTFSLREDGLVPDGCEISSDTVMETGYACACKVLREGAINY